MFPMALFWWVTCTLWLFLFLSVIMSTPHEHKSAFYDPSNRKTMHLSTFVNPNAEFIILIQTSRCAIPAFVTNQLRQYDVGIGNNT